MSYVDDVIADVKVKNANEPEFIQAVTEVLESLRVVVESDPKYQNQAILETVSGANEPSGLLPMQLPANMQTVEEQFEDVPRDMVCHTDTDGHKYDFAFGLNWSGVIDDSRVKKYK